MVRRRVPTVVAAGLAAAAAAMVLLASPVSGHLRGSFGNTGSFLLPTSWSGSLTRRRHSNGVANVAASSSPQKTQEKRGAGSAQRKLKDKKAETAKEYAEETVEEAEDYVEEAAAMVKDAIVGAKDKVVEAVENELGTNDEEGTDYEEGENAGPVSSEAAAARNSEESGTGGTTKKKKKNKKKKQTAVAATPAPTPAETEETTYEGSDEVTEDLDDVPGVDPWGQEEEGNDEEEEVSGFEDEIKETSGSTYSPTPQPTFKYVSVPEEEVEEWEEEPTDSEMAQHGDEEEEEEKLESAHDHTTEESKHNELETENDDMLDTAEYPPGDIEIAEEAIEVQAEEEAAKKVGGWAVVIALFGMIFTAWQVSENPDGVFASICRLSMTICGCVIKVLLLPFKYVCGNFFPSAGAHHPISQAPDYREPYRGRLGMVELS